jgi:hypothetical protein
MNSACITKPARGTHSAPLLAGVIRMRIMKSKLIKYIVYPSFWVKMFSLSFKENWIFILVFPLISGGSSLFKGEILQFIITAIFVLIVIGLMFFIYQLVRYIYLIIFDSEMRIKCSSLGVEGIAREVLGLPILEPMEAVNEVAMSEELPDKASKIGFSISILIMVSVTLGLIYLGYITANE